MNDDLRIPSGTARPAVPTVNPFAENMNPYASPQVPDYRLLVSSVAPFAGLWRDKNLLVMHKLAPLPDICVKSNVPATRRLTRKLRWHHPALGLTVLAGVWIYLIVALIVTKRATISIPMSEEWFEIRWRRILFAWGIGLASALLFVAGIAAVDQGNSPLPAFAILGSVILLIGALLYGQYATSMVSPKRMTNDYIWLKGLHPEFLDRLEVWQGNV